MFGCRSGGRAISFRRKGHGRIRLAARAGEARQGAHVGSRRSEAEKLFRILPERITKSLIGENVGLEDVIEVVLDYGRPPVARVHSVHCDASNPKRDVTLSKDPVAREELDFIVEQCSDFAEDNRAGIDGTLHRISAIRNRSGRIIGITCRVGEAVQGSAAMVEDIVKKGHSILLLGRPGVGKTTVIREISRMLADEAFKRVVIVDTSNEIAGDGDVTHPGIGRARRLQVPSSWDQHRVMIEAVENHMPNVVVIDEIGTQEESLAARSISQRGVQLVATAHGNVLENIIKNVSLQDLIGGISAVTLGDEESRRRGVQKSVLERTSPPTFDVVIEMINRTQWIIHTNVSESVDLILRGKGPVIVTREIGENNKVIEGQSGSILDAREELLASRSILSHHRKLFEQPCENAMQVSVEAHTHLSLEKKNKKEDSFQKRRSTQQDALQVYIEGIDDEVMRDVTREMDGKPMSFVSDLDEAQAVITTRASLQKNLWLKEVVKYSRIPLFLLRAGTKASVLKGLQKLLTNDLQTDSRLMPHDANSRPMLRATGGILECKSAVDDIVIKKNTPVELVPKDAETMLRVQAMAREYKLDHEVLGSDTAGTLRMRVLPKDFQSTTSLGIAHRKKKVEFW